MNQRFAGLADLRDVESLNLAAELAAEGTGPVDVFTRILAGTRDHARVPMAWDASHAGGFTTGEPWLPGDGSHASVNVAAQTGDPASVLEWYRRLIALRRASRTLVYGTTVTERSPRGVWRYRRADEQGEWLVVLNLTDRTQRARRPLPPWEFVMGSGPLSARALAPYEAQLWRRRR